jgi:hypothetical protein
LAGGRIYPGLKLPTPSPEFGVLIVNFRAIAEAIKRRKSELHRKNCKMEFRLSHIIVDKNP